MSAGEVSQPVRGPSGFTLIKLLETRDQTSKSVTEYNARGILVQTNEVVDSAQARAKIQALHARIVGGEDFAKIARENSEDTSTRNGGGDMGWFALQAWGSAVAEQIEQLADGQMSQPFETEAGWHIIERLGVREQDITEESRRNAARETIGRRKADEEFERFIRQLKDEAYIENRLAPA
jgi:peptidyl-prolyl cis-trans isomerase SurA